MFSNKVFDSKITEGAYTNLKEAIPHDKEELKKLFEETIRGQIKTSVARALIFEQFWLYVDLEKKIKNNISLERQSIALATLPFIDDIFINDYVRGIKTYHKNSPLWVSVSKDYPEVKAFKTEDIFESNSKRLIIDFQEEVYNRLVDEANKSKGEEQHFVYWEEIDYSFGFILGYIEMLTEISALLNDDFTHTLKRLSTVRKAERRTSANLTKQNIIPTEDYKSSDWYKNLSLENQSELDDILSDNKQPGFKPYINMLFEKDYFTLDENYTPILGKISSPDLKRLIKKLTPQSVNGKYVEWERFFQLDDNTLKNCSEYENPKSFKNILKDLGID